MTGGGFNPRALNLSGSTRFQRYREMLAFYNGRQWPGRASRNEKRLTFNYARVVVDKLTSYLMNGKSMRLGSGAGDEPPALVARAQRALRSIYHDNNLDVLDYETEVDTAILGDGCYKLTWDRHHKKVRVSAPDIQGVFAWWHGDDTSRVRKIALRYQLEEEEMRRLYPGVKALNESELVEVWTDDGFELWVNENRVEARANPYGFIPFVIFPNLKEAKSFWGKSDIEALVEPQVELNRALSQLSHILELSGNPIAVLENVDQAEGIRVKAGAVWTLPEDARAYLLDLLGGGGVQLHLGYIDLLYRALHDTAESPRAAFGGTSRDLSGVALEVELQPLLHKVWRKRLIRTAVYRKRAEMMLKMLDRFTGTEYAGLNIEVDWRPVLPRDFSRTVADEETLVNTGIHSRQRAMASMGVEDPAEEFNRWCEEQKAILGMERGGDSPHDPASR